MNKLSHSYMFTGKTIVLTVDLCGQSDVSVFYYAVSAYHSFSSKEQVSVKSMAAITVHSDFGAPKNKMSLLLLFPIYLPWSDGTRCYDLSFFNVELSASFFTFLFYHYQRPFSSSSSSAIRVVSHEHIFFFWATPHIGLSCLTRDRTCNPYIGIESFNHWISRKVLTDLCFEYKWVPGENAVCFLAGSRAFLRQLYMKHCDFLGSVMYDSSCILQRVWHFIDSAFETIWRLHRAACAWPAVDLQATMHFVNICILNPPRWQALISVWW